MSSLVCLVAVLLGIAGVLAKPESRGHDGKVSDQQHFSKTGEHNPSYDHDAFLGSEKSTFDKLSPEESKRRLGKMFEKIDKNKDKKISYEEMKEWIHYSGNRYVYDDANRLWKAIHKRAALDAKRWGTTAPGPDELVSWELYKNDSFGYDIKADQEKRYQRDRKRWEAADRNKDDKLSKDEYAALLHPSVFDHMQNVALDEAMLEMDTNKDGYVDLNEFLEDLMPQKERTGSKGEANELQRRREEFLHHRDTNKDGRLDKKELREYLFPSFDHIGAEAQHLINEVDTDKDNMLSKEEVLKNFEKFVSSRATEFGQAFQRHDEF